MIGVVRLLKFDRLMSEDTDLCSHCLGDIDWCRCDTLGLHLKKECWEILVKIFQFKISIKLS